MENPYKRKKEPEFNKQLILEASIQIGASEGWHKVTFQAIADKTGLSKGGIIHHFKNKEELLDELMNQSLSGFDDWIKDYRSKMPSVDPSIAYLQFVLDDNHDDKYRATMRVVQQAIMANEKYKNNWNEWYNANILPQDGSELSMSNLIALLVADGVWYKENFGFPILTKKQKQDILRRLGAK